MSELNRIIEEIKAERARQDAMFGELPRHLKPTFYLTILTEEVGEVARAIINGNSLGYRKELIQLAAVALAAIEEFDSGSAIGYLEDVCVSIKYQKDLNRIAEIEQEPNQKT